MLVDIEVMITDKSKRSLCRSKNGKFVKKSIIEKSMKGNKAKAEIAEKKKQEIKKVFDGKHVVDLSVLAANLHCKNCKSLLDLNKTHKKTLRGLDSILHIACDSCNSSNLVRLNKTINIEGKNVSEINCMAVFGKTKILLFYTVIYIEIFYEQN